MDKIKCDFCRYWSGSSCMATPNSYFCSEAKKEWEYYRYLAERKQSNNQTVKSFRIWDKHKLN